MAYLNLYFKFIDQLKKEKIKCKLNSSLLIAFKIRIKWKQVRKVVNIVSFTMTSTQLTARKIYSTEYMKWTQNK